MFRYLLVCHFAGYGDFTRFVLFFCRCQVIKEGRNLCAPLLNLQMMNRELKKRRRLRKRHLKSESALPETLSRLFHLV